MIDKTESKGKTLLFALFRMIRIIRLIRVKGPVSQQIPYLQ